MTRADWLWLKALEQASSHHPSLPLDPSLLSLLVHQLLVQDALLRRALVALEQAEQALGRAEPEPTRRTARQACQFLAEALSAHFEETPFGACPPPPQTH